MATRLVFTVAPSSAVAGAAISPVVVEARDAAGAIVPTFTGAVTIAIDTNPGTGTLSGTTTRTAVGGIATFGDLHIDRSGIGYRLRVTAAGLSAAQSATFTISPGPAFALAITVQPGNTAGGAIITPAVEVTARDALGNTATGFTGAVTVAITPGTGTAGATLAGTTTITAVSGIAGFSTLSIAKAGAGYTLSAATAGLPEATSAPFAIAAGPASELVFTLHPATTTAGSAMTPPVVVTARDALGNTADGFTSDVTVAITAGTGGGGATLSGPATLAAIEGVATFPGLSIDKVGTGYTLSASATGVSGTTSAAFDITHGPAAVLVVTGQPTSTTAGATIAPAVTVTALDLFGNTATGFTDDVSLAITAGTGTSGAALAGTTTATPLAGVATFSTLSIARAGTGYTLSATAAGGGPAPATSAAFDIAAGPASGLAFTVQPVTTTAGALITPAVEVTVQDALGNRITGFAGDVTVALGANPGSGTLSGTLTVGAVAGVATFADLGIARSGIGYTLAATTPGLTGATSAPFNIPAGTATELVFRVQPVTAAAGAAIVVEVVARDALGNTADGFVGVVGLAITPGTGTAGAALLGTTSLAAAAGVATFPAIAIDSAGSGYTLTASATGLPGVGSVAFGIVPGTATRLAFTAQPATTTAGVTMTPAIAVTVRDAVGNTVTGFNGNVTLAIGTNPGSGTLSGTTTLAAVAGVATFSDLRIKRSGIGYTLTAAAAALTGATSAPFDIAAAPAIRLAFTAPPTTTTAGATISPAVQVTAFDSLDNVATSFSALVTVGIAANPGGGTLSGATSLAAVAGVATFALGIDKSGLGYTLSAAAAAVAGVTSGAFDINPGTATQLVVTAQPTNTTGGATITPAVQVTARDGLGNTATAFTGAVTVSLTPGTGAPGATLSGTLTVSALAGVINFPDLSVDKAATGYTLSATATGGGPTGATSAPFNVAVGAPIKLAFTGQPVTTAAGASITPALLVSAQDAGGNTVTSYAGDVTVAIGSNPGSGTLSGTLLATAAAGVATFADLAIDRSGIGYTLTATATGGLAGATSATFTIVPGPAAVLSFTVPPATTTAGVPFTPALEVTARDAQGNVATGFTGGVTVAIGTNPAGGTLSGITTVAAVAGVATFSLSIDRVGSGYTLSATAAGGPAGAASGPFDIVVGEASQLAFTAQPTNATAGTTLSPAVVVRVQDAAGNTVPDFTAGVTVAITTGTGTAGATLSGATTVGAVSGIATFSSLRINKSGTGYTLTATVSGLTSAVSATFNINPAPATQLDVTVDPTTATAGASITPAVQVTALDSLGNTVPSYSGQVTVAIGTNPSGGTLAGTKTVAAVLGVASFANLSINKTGVGYTLSAAAAGLAGATSAAFDIVPAAASQLIFTVQPTTTMAGAPITPAVQVTAMDLLGNIATGFTGNVTVAIGTNPAGGTLAGTTTVAAVAGVAAFPDLSINKAATGYALSASAPGGVPATGVSAQFAILVGTAARLAYTVQPASATAGAPITPAVRVTAQDSSGNTVPGFTGSVTVAITAGTGTAGATLSGATTVGAVAGVATFSTLEIDKSGTGYTLTASSNGLSPAVSGTFSIVPGTTVLLAFTVQPATAAAGQSISPAVQVTGQDALGNTTPAFTGNVTVAIGTNPGGGVLFGTTTVAAVAGVATYSNLNIHKAGAGYTLSATAAGLAGGTSAPFDITAGAATKLVFGVQPSSEPALTTITPAVQVLAQDALGNTATGFTASVSVAIASNPAGGVLSGTTSVPAVAGVATFSDLAINQVGNGYTLAATSGGLTAATSVSFDITSGATFVFSTQPTTTTAGATIAPAVRVTAKDGLGNTITSFTGGVTVSIAQGTGTPGAALSGTTTVSAVAGVATFSDLSIDKSGTGYRLGATGTGFTPGTSGLFTINAGAPTKLGFIAQPSTTPAGATIIPGVQVALQDALGNTVKGVSGSVTVTIGTNPSGGILSGTTTASFSGGVAAFATLSIDQAGTGYTLAATSTGYTGATSVAFNITAAAATRLVFTLHPSAATAGEHIAPPVEVSVWDAAGNTVTGFSGEISVSITAGSGANGATLSGTTTVQAVAGVATFPDLSIDKAGTGFKLSASASGVAGVNSLVFVVTAGAATQLVFSTQPTSTAVNATITPAVEVSARDALGNVDKTFTLDVTIAFAVNPGGGTLSGNPTVAAVEGVATFSDLRINMPGVGYRFSASAAGLPMVTSSAFSITP